ncbi:MAG: hypothetical protein JW791_00860 [Nanoarchaeota archaeon]|nr:hypothetical protein [Nanoarchaeota archaeon]
MKKNQEGKKYSKFILIGLSIILLSSVFTIFTFDEPVQNMKVNVQYVILGQQYSPSEEELVVNSTLYNLLINNIGAVLEQDGDINRIGNIQNSFSAKTYWQVLLNNELLQDYNIVLQEQDKVILYYGDLLEFFNITISVDMLGLKENNSLKVQKSLTIMQLLNGYQSLVFENNTINCLFDLCSNENNTWIVKINNETVNNYSRMLSEADILSFSYN